MKLKYTLFAFTDDDRQWALRFVDHRTGKSVSGTVCGGESNIYAILRVWNPELDNWDRSIQFVKIVKTKREFKYLTEGWDHLGSQPEDLAARIKAGLKKRRKKGEE